MKGKVQFIHEQALLNVLEYNVQCFLRLQLKHDN